MYALRVREAINLLLLGEEGSYVPDMDASMEAKLADGFNARSACAGFIIIVVIIGVS